MKIVKELPKKFQHVYIPEMKLGFRGMSFPIEEGDNILYVYLTCGELESDKVWSFSKEEHAALMKTSAKWDDVKGLKSEFVESRKQNLIYITEPPLADVHKNIPSWVESQKRKIEEIKKEYEKVLDL